VVSGTLAAIQVDGELAFVAVISACGADPAMIGTGRAFDSSHLFHDAAPLQFKLTNTYSI
jgi:hypothetical protein